MSLRQDTVIAISPQLDRIAWRIGRFKSDFTFPNPSDRFYHEHYVRMLENGNFSSSTTATAVRRLRAGSTAVRWGSRSTGRR